MDEEDPNKIYYADKEYDLPMVQIAVKVDRNFNNDIYVMCIPNGTYHISGNDLDVVTDTIFDLISNGLIKRY